MLIFLCQSNTSMNIGPIHLSSCPVLALAPMAGYTDAAFRTLIARRDADLVFSKLSSASSLARTSRRISEENAKTRRLMQVGDGGITGIQLFGSSPTDVAEAVGLLCREIEAGKCKASLLDLNFGCPAPKVVRNGGGSALLADVQKVKAIAQAAVKAAGSIPVTAKIRLARTAKANSAIARALESAGIAAITVHGRTAAQKFSGKSDWKSIGEVVSAVSIPIFGNGDVREPADVRAVCDTSGCAGVMVGRAVLSNPMFFVQARQYLQTGKFEQTKWEDKLLFMREYILLMPHFDLPFHAAKDLAIQLAAGFRGSARLRAKLMMAKSGEELMAMMESASPQEKAEP